MTRTEKEEKTFADFDKFGLKQFADQLTRYILVDRGFVEESYVLSLNSEFGSGKTTFFEMWRNELASKNEFSRVIYLNAWEADFQGDALLAIVSGFIDLLKDDTTKATRRKIKETAGKLSKFALSIGNDVVQRFTGIDPIKAGQYAESTDRNTESTVGEACFEIYREKQAVFDELRTQLRDLTGQQDKPILIIIDELDRCRPTYAIEFLETIKHFFDIDGLIFVLGVDRSQLASSAKALFGHELDFDEYYRKFAHRNVNLPVKGKTVAERFCTALVNEYLSKPAFEKRGRFSHVNQDQHATESLVELCTAFSLNARQVHEVLRVAAHVFSASKETQSHLLWGWHASTLFMAVLYVKKNDFYHRIGRREVSFEQFTTFLVESGLCKEKRLGSFWWAAVLYLGAFGPKSVARMEAEFKKLGVWEHSADDKDAFQKELSGFQGAYGRFGDVHVFSEIHSKLEGLRAFAEGP